MHSSQSVLSSPLIIEWNKQIEKHNENQQKQIEQHIRGYLDQLQTKENVIQALATGCAIMSKELKSNIGGECLSSKIPFGNKIVRGVIGGIYSAVAYMFDPHVWEVLKNDYHNAGGGIKGIEISLIKFISDIGRTWGIGAVQTIVVNEIIEAAQNFFEKQCGTPLIEFFEAHLGCITTNFLGGLGVGIAVLLILKLVLYGYSFLNNKGDISYGKVYRADLFSTSSNIRGLVQVLMGAVAAVFVTNPWVMLIVAIAIPIIYWAGEQLTATTSVWKRFKNWWYGIKPVPIAWVGPNGSSVIECCPFFDPSKPENCAFINLICPIKLELMIEPVMISCGHIFEGQAIEKWIIIQGNRATCPVCRQSISPSPNYRKIDSEFKALIEEIALHYNLSKVYN